MTKPRTIDDFDGPFRLSGEEINFRNCPACGDTRWKVYVNSESGHWVCFSGSCGIGGRIDVGIDPDRLLAVLSSKRTAERKAWDWPAVDMPPLGPVEGEVKSYLQGRRFDGPCEALYKLRSADNEKSVFIPYFGRTGEVIYYSTRDATGARERKYINMPGRHPLYVPGFAIGQYARTPKIVVVEVAFDAMRVHMAGYPVVALGGKSLAQYLQVDLLDLATEELVIMLDSDAIAHAMKLASQMYSRINVSIVPNMPRGKDPADLMYDQVHSLLEWTGSKQ